MKVYKNRKSVFSLILAAVILASVSTLPTMAAEAEKNETVYVIADSEGTKEKVIVDEWLKNKSSADKIEDYTELDDVKNVKGNEDYAVGVDNMKVWDAQGNDIYYSGTTQKPLPVDIKITYTLDGKKITPDEIKGKSGKVSIRFDYTDKEKAKVTIDGKEEEINVPFLMVSGVVFDNTKLKNIEITNGKTISTGEKTIAVGIALPGLSENLDVKTDKFDLPEYVEITGEAQNFEITTTLTYAAADVFSELNLNDVKDIDTLKSSLDDMKTASLKLVDGSETLYKGLDTLLTKSGEMVDGVQKLSDGAGTLSSGLDTLLSKSGEIKSGVNLLDNGATMLNDNLNTLKSSSTQMSDGVNVLSSGSNTIAAGLNQLKDKSCTLVSGVNTLNDGAGKISTGASYLAQKVSEANDGVAYLQSKMAELSQGADFVAAGTNQLYTDVPALAAGAEQLISGLSDVKNGADTLTSGIGSAKETLDTTIVGNETVLASLQQLMAAETDDTKKQALQSAIDGLTETIDGQKQLSASMGEDGSLYQGATAVSAGVSSGTSGISDLKNNLDTLVSSSETLSTGAATVSAGGKEILDGIKNLAEGTTELNGGVAELAEKTSELSSGTSELKEKSSALIGGVTELADGSGKVKSGMEALAEKTTELVDGAEKLADGSATLKNGLDTLNGGTDSLIVGVNQLDEGSKTLQNGLNTFKTSSTDLIDGVTQLKVGSLQLSDGMKEFNDKGVQKLVDAVDGDVSKLITRLKATSDVARNYNHFGGKSTGTKGEVKFIYKTDDIG